MKPSPRLQLANLPSALATIAALILFAANSPPLAFAQPKAIDIQQSAGHLEEYQPNACNNSELAAESGLTKTSLGQFLGYPCSADFYHCRWQSDGFRTYKKSCRVGEWRASATSGTLGGCETGANLQVSSSIRLEPKIATTIIT